MPFLAVCFAITAIGTLASRAEAIAIEAVWNGGTGYWNDYSLWSCGSVPNNTPTDSYNVFVDNDPDTASVVNVNTSATVDNLSVDAGDLLRIASGERRPEKASLLLCRKRGKPGLRGWG